jgi:hypothetical protein
MSVIQIKKIIEAQKLDIKLVAAELFPTVSFPVMSLTRILTGHGELSAWQVKKFSEITNLPIGFIYCAGKWEVKQNFKFFSKKETGLRFKAGEVFVDLDIEKWVSVIALPQKDSSLFHVIVETKNAPLSVYLSEITDVIIKHYEFNKY